MDARFMQIHNLVLTREVIINSIFPVDRMRELKFPSRNSSDFNPPRMVGKLNERF